MVRVMGLVEPQPNCSQTLRLQNLRLIHDQNFTSLLQQRERGDGPAGAEQPSGVQRPSWRRPCGAKMRVVELVTVGDENQIWPDHYFGLLVSGLGHHGVPEDQDRGTNQPRLRRPRDSVMASPAASGESDSVTAVLWVHLGQTGRDGTTEAFGTPTTPPVTYLDER
ncbi:hypothetical protein D4764_12G0011560 [Takifugu flavidus]|uniref:Uncharacterized protein n=1 Tax=Takifugu flavidus TaxID=433684 RepID=A0A5C6PFC0_9TELE|nr:hypothetical protein D4764_12G0011560 [Takifugu flavidus]